MSKDHPALIDAKSLVVASERAEADALHAIRWFRVFVAAQAAYALAFTLSLDIAGVDYWVAFAPFALATTCIWFLAFQYRRAIPRHGLRNMGIAVAVWFTLYTLMLDPALQLFQLTSLWWWVLAGVVAISPMLACLFASSRQ